MKKTYMKPQTEAIELELQGLIATSTPVFGGGGSGSGDSREFDDDFFSNF